MNMKNESFLKLTNDDGTPILVGVSQIKYIRPVPNGETQVSVIGAIFYVREPYTKILAALAACTLVVDVEELSSQIKLRV